EIAHGDRRHDLDDPADLPGQILRHDVHGVGQIFPRSGDTEDRRLTAEPAFRANLTRNARYLAGKSVELIHHRVDGVFQFENLAFHIDGNLTRKVAAGDRRRNLRDIADLHRQFGREKVDVVG